MTTLTFTDKSGICENPSGDPKIPQKQLGNLRLTDQEEDDLVEF